MSAAGGLFQIVGNRITEGTPGKVSDQSWFGQKLLMILAIIINNAEIRVTVINNITGTQS